MLKKDERSRNLYENKQISDNVPGKKSDIYVLDSAILYKRIRILQKSPAYLSVLEARDEFLASVCSNSRHGHPVREGDMARMAKAHWTRRQAAVTP
jgi:hypothetical protein